MLLLLLLFEIRFFFFLRIIIFATCHSHTYVGQSETTSRLVRWHLLNERGKNQFGKTRTNIFWFWIFLWTVMHFDTSHMMWSTENNGMTWQLEKFGKSELFILEKITLCKKTFFFSYHKDYLDQVVLFTLMVQNQEFLWMMFCAHQAFTFSMLRYQLLWLLTPTYFNSPFLLCSVYPLSFFLTCSFLSVFPNKFLFCFFLFVYLLHLSISLLFLS